MLIILAPVLLITNFANFTTDGQGKKFKHLDVPDNVDSEYYNNDLNTKTTRKQQSTT